MTQLEIAKNGHISEEMKVVAQKELIDESKLMTLIAEGKVVIPANINHKNLNPIGIGKQMKTKVNANIGTSGDYDRIEDEVKKINMVVKYKADTVMDLSTAGDITNIRRELIKRSTIPFGNVPVYQMVIDILKKGKTRTQKT